MTPYSYCNLHGKWAASVRTIVPGQYRAAVAALKQVCKESVCTDGSPAAYTINNMGSWAGQEASHIPVAARSGNVVTVTVAHPQSSAHHIAAVWLTDENNAVIAFAYLDTATASPPQSVQFNVSADTGAVNPFVFCNLHGIYRGQAVVTLTSPCDQGHLSTFPQLCPGGMSACNSGTPAAYTTGSTGEWEAGKASSHVPAVSQISNSVNITVNHAESIASASTHVIAAVWAFDQNRQLIFCQLRPNMATVEVDTVKASFVVEPSVTSVVAYEWCSIHGTWKSSALTLELNALKVAALKQVPADSDVAVYSFGVYGVMAGTGVSAALNHRVALCALVWLSFWAWCVCFSSW